MLAPQLVVVTMSYRVLSPMGTQLVVSSSNLSARGAKPVKRWTMAAQCHFNMAMAQMMTSATFAVPACFAKKSARTHSLYIEIVKTSTSHSSC